MLASLTPFISTQHLQSLSKLQLPAFQSYSNPLKITSCIYYSWYTFLSGKLKLSKTFTITQLTHFFLFVLITNLAVHKLVGGEMFNEKSNSSARVYLLDRAVEENPHLSSPRFSGLMICPSTRSSKVSHCGWLSKKIQVNKPNLLPVSFFFPHPFMTILDFWISVLVPGLGLLTTNYPIKTELKY